jgi:DNA-binding MarR family transcriptional regulator
MAQSTDYAALAAFRYEIRRFLNFSENAARHAGIEPHQHQALLAIKGLPSGQKATIGVLAERLQIQHHSAVELSDRLEASGLIRRVRNKVDRREVLLRLTPKGEKLLRRLSSSHKKELRVAGRQLLKALVNVIDGIGGESRRRSSLLRRPKP